MFYSESNIHQFLTVSLWIAFIFTFLFFIKDLMLFFAYLCKLYDFENAQLYLQFGDRFTHIIEISIIKFWYFKNSNNWRFNYQYFSLYLVFLFFQIVIFFRQWASSLILIFKLYTIKTTFRYTYETL